jgi:hypothetical protein
MATVPEWSQDAGQDGQFLMFPSTSIPTFLFKQVLKRWASLNVSSQLRQ